MISIIANVQWSDIPVYAFIINVSKLIRTDWYEKLLPWNFWGNIFDAASEISPCFSNGNKNSQTNEDEDILD